MRLMLLFGMADSFMAFAVGFISTAAFCYIRTHGGPEHDGAARKARHLCFLLCAYRVLKVHSGRGEARRWRMVCTFSGPVPLCADRILRT